MYLEDLTMPEEMKTELKTLWARYRIYADACVDAGTLPAPFGVTAAEGDLVTRIKAFFDKGPPVCLRQSSATVVAV